MVSRPPARLARRLRAVAIVINWRMKGQCMRWRRHNASAVVALRVRELNVGWEPDTHSPRLAGCPRFLIERATRFCLTNELNLMMMKQT